MLVHWLFDREAMLATIAARDTTSHVVLATDRVLLPVPVVGQYQTTDAACPLLQRSSSVVTSVFQSRPNAMVTIRTVCLKFSIDFLNVGTFSLALAAQHFPLILADSQPLCKM